jgi:hypothetical protein
VRAALVVRAQEADLDSVVTTTRALRRGAGRTRVKVGDRIRMEELLHLSLMVSDNFATRELAVHDVATLLQVATTDSVLAAVMRNAATPSPARAAAPTSSRTRTAWSGTASAPSLL